MRHEDYPEMFERLKKKNEGALMPFIVAGYPDLKTSIKIARTLVESGADALEIGFPFSDPIADGATIQNANVQALKNKMTVEKGFKLVSKIRKHVKVPIGLLLYYNLVYQKGIYNFYKKAKNCGVNGILIADLPPEEASDAVKAARKYKLHQIFLIAQTTSNKRLKMISKYSSGFHYLVSVMGVTGARKKIKKETIDLIKRVKSVSPLPVLVGFGISKPWHVREVINAGADGAIVGSALIDLIGKNIGNPELLNIISRWIKEMKNATRSAIHEKVP